jgi:D-tyrosyl-tRNA(Tyr) deacylase
MRAVIQRVREGSVTIQGNEHARIGRGFVILLGIREGDTERDALFLADKCAALRVFEDDRGKMNLNLDEIRGSVMVISQFTLYGDAHKGNRPSFTLAARPEEAIPLYEYFLARIHHILGESRVRSGVFGAKMEVGLVNDGPVTIIIDSPSSRTTGSTL